MFSGKDWFLLFLFSTSIGSVITLLILQVKIWIFGSVTAVEPIRLILGVEILCSVYAICGLFYLFHKMG